MKDCQVYVSHHPIIGKSLESVVNYPRKIIRHGKGRKEDTQKKGLPFQSFAAKPILPHNIKYKKFKSSCQNP